MRKVTFMISLLILISSSAFAATHFQDKYRWRNDDGSETEATWKADENQEIEYHKIENIRLRFQFYVDGSVGDANTLYLYYSTNTDDWTKITTDGSTNHFVLALSNHFDDQDPTTRQLSENIDWPFTAGKMIESSSSIDYSNSISDESTEYEICIKPTSNAQSDTYYFRLERDVWGAFDSEEYAVMNYSNIIYVDADASGNNDGSSWEDAYTSLQDALDDAENGQQIWVAAGTYKPETEVGGSGDRYKTFQMIEGVEIYGGFAGNENPATFDLDTRDFAANETILSGDLNGDDVVTGSAATLTFANNSENCYHVFYQDQLGLTDAAELNGFTIYGGNADGTGNHDYGSGMYNEQCYPTLNNIIFRNNQSVTGVLYFYNISTGAQLSNLIFENNDGGYYGALYIEGSTGNSVLTNALIINNKGEYGGGLYNSDALTTINNATFSGNYASSDGGGVYNTSGVLTLNNCIIWENKADGDGDEVYYSEYGGSSTNLNYSCHKNEAGDIFGTLTTSNCITSDPKFIDPDNDIFALYGISPCVNTGNNSNNSEDYDIRGENRIQNTTIDMGCYEWTEGTDPLKKYIFVKHDASGDNDGSSWANAFNSLQVALDAASSGDHIWVAAGTYKPETEVGGSGDRYKTFQMKEGVGIYGGFAGNEDPTTFDLEERNFATNETILSGDIGNVSDNSDNCYHVFYHPNGFNLTTSAVLDGFTITGGNADDDATHYNGGGMYNHSSSPTLSNCKISYNSASYYGGGIFNNSSSSPTLTNCIISNNFALSGGGMYNNESSLELINCILSNNSAYMGGGMFNIESSPELINCTISNNFAYTAGGGMFNNASSPTLKNSIFWGNSASTSGNQIYISSGTTTLYYSCYSNESGDIDGTLNTSDCTNSNPKFVDPNNDDFTLYGTSPCVNIGNNTYNSETYDLRGEDRIQNTTIDMGCYEWTEGTDPLKKYIFVNDNASGNNDGTSWANAFNSLQDALDEAVSDDRIWVAAGTYKPSQEYNGATDTPREFIFRMKNGVEIYGGFAGTEDPSTFDLDDRDFQANETILSGDKNGDDSISGSGETLSITNNDENCYHVFFSSNYGLTSSAVLDGFTISGGNANGGGGHNFGGGMYIYDDDPTLKNLTFKNNSSNNYGSIYFYSSESKLTNALFINNYGGAVLSHGISSIEITNATFSGNYNPGYGGAIQLWDASIILYNCILWNNYDGNNGNEIYRSGDYNSITLFNCCYKNEAGDVYGSITTSNCITSDPKFVDPDNDNYTLYGISPCVNTGNNSYVASPYLTANKDLRGENRIQNTTIDMGCYEWTEGTDPFKKYIFVNDNASGNNDGTSWANAFNSFQDALDEAVSDDEIWVAAGTYNPEIEVGGAGDRYKTFQMKEGVGIYGGFYGSETNISQRDIVANETILSGDIGTADDYSDNCYHIFYHPSGLGITSATVLDGFTITGANANGSDQASYGGGFYNNTNSPTIRNCIIENNRALFGAGIRNDNSTPKLINVLIINNTATTSGGGIYNSISSELTLTNTTISNNSAANGGGIFNTFSSSISGYNSIIWGNSASNIGKQISNSMGSIVNLYYSCYSNKTGDIHNSSTFSPDENCVTENPRFVDSFMGDFRLKLTSPCIDIGNDAYNSETSDIRGVEFSRKLLKTDHSQIGNIDLGAYEYKEGADPSCEQEVWVDATYSSHEDFGFTHFTNLGLALGAVCVGGTVNIANHSNTIYSNDVNFDNLKVILGDYDLEITGNITAGLIQTTNVGKLIMKDLTANTTKTFPIADGTNNYTMTITTSDVNNPDISVRISNLNPTGSINSDFWEIDGPENLDATITFRVDKASIAPKTLGSSTNLRYNNGSRYVPVNGDNFSIEEFNDHYIITITSVNKF